MPDGGLYTRAIGTAGPRIAFVHGLFGQGRNWTQVAKALAGRDGTRARALLIDLPDHGRSPWGATFSLEGYADAVARALEAHAPGESYVVVGHSLGGKVAMTLALTRADLVSSLVVVDIAPRDYGSLERFEGYIEAMRALPLDQIDSRADADEAFAHDVPDPAIRGFLLQNLRRDGDRWRWQLNLDLIEADAARGEDSGIAGWSNAPGARYDGPTVFLSGAESQYVRHRDRETIRELFPRARFLGAKGAGHWVHSDAPDVVIATLSHVLRRR